MSDRKIEQWWIDEAASTNRLAMELLADGQIHGALALICRKQTAGEGQRGNSWESEPFSNITMSVILQPSFLQADEQFRLSQAVSLAIVSFLAKQQLVAQIKWPNDIYVNNKKICGILIENRLIDSTIDASVVGIGLNINQTVFVSNAPNPTSLRLETNASLKIEDAVDQLLFEIMQQYLLLMNNKQETHQRYMHHLYLFNKSALFSDGNCEFVGEIRDVLSLGLLQVWDCNSQQLRSFAFKEIRFLQ